MARWRREEPTRARAGAGGVTKRLVVAVRPVVPVVMALGLSTGLFAVPAGATTLLSPAGAPERPTSSSATGRASSHGTPGAAKSQADGQGKGSAKAKAKHAKAAQKPVKPFVEPASAVATLLASVGSDEHQLMGLDAYSEAQAYIGKAETGVGSAASALASATVVVGKAKAEEARAVKAEGVARGKLELDQSALYELGMAEYTGRGAMAGTDLASEERQVQFTELTKVAATDEGALFQTARVALTATVRWVDAERLAVSEALRAEARAKVVLTAAQEQLARSRAAVLDARTWATVPGEEPSQPMEELVALESGQEKGDRGSAAAGAKRESAGRRVLIAGDLRGGSAQTGGTGTGAAPAPGNLSYLTAGGPTILGPSVLSASQIAGWFVSTGAVANAAVPIAQLARDYIAAGKRTGVRGDVAFAQSVLETGYFSFPDNGEDPGGYNNFAGIGACASCKHGWEFSSALAGVLAQESLLGEYAGVVPQSGPEGQPKRLSEDFGVTGCCRTWMSLSGVWASNPNYGYDILLVYKEMLDWVVSQELQTTGLVSPQILGSRILRGGA